MPSSAAKRAKRSSQANQARRLSGASMSVRARSIHAGTAFL